MEGVGDLVRYGVGGIEVGEAVQVRVQMAQSGDRHLTLMFIAPEFGSE